MANGPRKNKLRLSNKDAVKNLLNKYKYLGDDNHWLWLGAKNGKGRGHVTIDHQNIEVHRLSAYVYLDLDIDDPKQIACHKTNCLRKDCWNPEHLYIGTKESNMKDFFEVVPNHPNWTKGQKW